MKYIYDNIKSLRKERGISQVDMAKLLDMYQANYGKLEKGDTELSVSRLYKIADIFGVGVERILGISEDNSLSLERDFYKKLSEELKLKVEKIEDHLKDLKLRASLFDKIENYYSETLERAFYSFVEYTPKVGKYEWLFNLEKDEYFNSLAFIIFQQDIDFYRMGIQEFAILREIKLVNAFERFIYINSYSFEEIMDDVEFIKIFYEDDFVNKMIDKKVNSGRFNYHDQEIIMAKENTLRIYKEKTHPKIWH